MVRGNSTIGKKEKTQFIKIFNCLLELEEAAIGEIAHYLEMEKSAVSARVNKMLQLGILQEAGKRKVKGGS